MSFFYHFCSSENDTKYFIQELYILRYIPLPHLKSFQVARSIGYGSEIFSIASSKQSSNISFKQLREQLE